MPLVSVQAAVFYCLAAGSVASAILAVTRNDPVHSMLWVLALFLHVAGVFLLLCAEFLAAVQVIIYAGAILVFYLFVLMLLDLPSEQARPPFGTHWPLALAAAAAIAGVIWLAQRTGPDPAAALGHAARSGAAETAAELGNLERIGLALFGPFALPFEIAGLVLLASIVGAVVLARRRATT